MSVVLFLSSLAHAGVAGIVGVSTGCDQPSIQAAVASAPSGATILIAPGVHHENVTLNSQPYARIAGADDATCTTEGTDPTKVTISGGGTGRTLLVPSHADTTIASLTLADGAATEGANLAVYGATVHLDNVHVRDGVATTYGGGAHAFGADLFLDADTRIHSNQAADGGGVSIRFAGLTMSDNAEVFGNSATGDGGGVLVWDRGVGTLGGDAMVHANVAQRGGGLGVSDATVDLTGDARIAFNTAATGGGVLLESRVVDSTLTLASGTEIVSNDAVDGGGVAALPVAQRTFLALAGGWVWDNDATQHGGGVYAEGGYVLLESGGAVHRNRAIRGGGVHATSTTVDLTDQSLVLLNDATDDGGGLWLDDAEVRMDAGIVMSNTSGADGGGWWSRDSQWDVTGGLTLGNQAEGHGGGFYAQSEDLTLTGADVHSNDAGVDGGGIYTFFSDLHLTNVHVDGNTATRGGGLYLEESTLTFDQSDDCDPMALPANTYCSELRDNEASSDGGGLLLDDKAGLLSGVAVLGNLSSIGSGLTVDAGASLTVEDSLVADNVVLPTGLGFGATVRAVGYVTLRRSTLAGNLGTGVRTYAASSSAIVDRSIVWGNVAGAGHHSVVGGIAYLDSTSQGGTGPYSGSFDPADPMFFTTARGDYRLPWLSPAFKILSGPRIGLDQLVIPAGAPSNRGAFE